MIVGVWWIVVRVKQKIDEDTLGICLFHYLSLLICHFAEAGGMIMWVFYIRFAIWTRSYMSILLFGSIFLSRFIYPCQKLSVDSRVIVGGI